MSSSVYMYPSGGSSLVPNHEVYELLRESILVLSGDEMVYANKALRDFLGTVSLVEQEDFVKKVIQFRDGEVSELQVFDELPFEELKSSALTLTDNSKAQLFILNNVKQITLDAEHFHYKLLLTAEDELGFGCWNINIKDDIIFWSNGMARIFGYANASEVRGESNWEGFLDHLPKDYRTLVNKKVQDKLANGLNDSNKRTEVRILKIDGTRRLVALKTHYIERSKAGEVLSLYGTIRDVTDIRNNEKTIRQQLNDLNKSNDALTEFAYTASHDLQEPLRKIEAYGSRLKSSLGAEMPENSERYLSKLLSSTMRMSKLIEDILTLSRLNSVSIESEPVDLNEVMEGIVVDYEESIRNSNATVTYDLPTIPGIKTQFHQLFQNMLGNAVKFRHPDRSPEVNISYLRVKKSEKVMYHLDYEKKYYVIKIQDNGIGFDQQFEDTIYKPFKRLVGRTEFSGTGIGLAICKKVVDNHDGFIRAESQEDVGTTFYLYFPY